MQYDYGVIERGYSYEYYNFYLSLQQMGHDVTIFDYMIEMNSLGKIAMNKKLFELVKSSKPTLTMFSLYTDQLDPTTIKKLSNHSKTLCFFHDDTWRVDYSIFWSKQFDYFTTPDIFGEHKYKKLGMNNSIYFPFGINENLYYKMDVEKKYDVSFVGGFHPFRKWMIKRLEKAGISTKVSGYGWPTGILDHKDMVTMFNETKVNLNLSNSSSWDFRYLLSSWRATAKTIISRKTVEQLKARQFEINGCGAFQLSYYTHGLEKNYTIGDEIAVYIDPDDFIDKVKYYLDNHNLRESIAKAGYVRTLNDHTFTKRFKIVFDRMGL